MVSAIQEHHLILTVQAVAEQPAIQVYKPYILLVLLPVTAILQVVTVDIHHQKFTPEHLMVPVVPKKPVTQVVQLAQALVHQVIHTHP